MTRVRVNQVWADNDKRAAGRLVRVVEISGRYAMVELVGQRGRPASRHEDKQVAKPGRRTRIQLDRFRPTTTGYRLHTEAPPPGTAIDEPCPDCKFAGPNTVTDEQPDYVCTLLTIWCGACHTEFQVNGPGMPP
jgi:hypothetical protein